MKIISNYDLTNLNTFRIPARAKFFVEISSENDLKEILALPEFKENEKLILGGGSNILFTRDFDGLVILNKMKGIEILSETEDSVLIRAMSGEVWHDLVKFSIERGYWGIENLSSIPGSVGAAPMQNIGAYGAELNQVLDSVEAINVGTGAREIFKREKYQAGYRESIFKNELKGEYFIIALTVKLSKIPKPNISYKSLREYLEKNKIETKELRGPIGLREISQAVTEIRKEKLPDPGVISNAGSFFKNPFIDEKKLEEMLKLYPKMPYFKTDSQEDLKIKLSAGWLIEESGWKGKRIGDAGVYEKHALVLVNHGGATGEEIKNLAEEIIKSVEDKFSLTLVPEVNMV